jgi:hypothetical protein
VPYRIALLVLLLITIPYLAAWVIPGSEYSFGGFLLNPLDGNSYLAKMYEGWRGDWRFTLPYTALPNQGVYLFTYYILLGHLARVFGVPLLAIFHLARLLGSLVLLWALWRFMQNLLLPVRITTLVYAIACLGLGMGWLAFPFHVVPSDFWVAEAYSLLSAYTNPHFVLSLGLFVWLLTVRYPPKTESQPPQWAAWIEAAIVIMASIVLGSISPFAVVSGWAILGTVLAGKIMDRWRSMQSLSDDLSGMIQGVLVDPMIRKILARLGYLFLGGAPVVLYTFWVIQIDPQLAAWNAQNLTPTPPVWDLILAFSPALLLALFSLTQVWRNQTLQVQIAGVWAVLACVMVYSPLGLQRRFLVGLSIPLSALSGLGLLWLEKRFTRRFRSIAITALVLTFPTLLLVLAAGQSGVLTHDPLLYLKRSEVEAFSWIESNTPKDALILAAPQTGMFIPGHTGRRVLYGHPFETVDADVEQAAVTSFFANAAANPQAARNFLEHRKIEYIFYGPREQQLGQLPDLRELDIVYSHPGVTVYRVVD